MYVVPSTILYFLKSVRGSNHIIAAREVRKVARFLSFLNDMFSLKFSGRYHLQKVAAAQCSSAPPPPLGSKLSYYIHDNASS